MDDLREQLTKIATGIKTSFEKKDKQKPANPTICRAFEKMIADASPAFHVMFAYWLLKQPLTCGTKVADIISFGEKNIKRLQFSDLTAEQTFVTPAILNSCVVIIQQLKREFETYIAAYQAKHLAQVVSICRAYASDRSQYERVVYEHIVKHWTFYSLINDPSVTMEEKLGSDQLRMVNNLCPALLGTAHQLSIHAGLDQTRPTSYAIVLKKIEETRTRYSDGVEARRRTRHATRAALEPRIKAAVHYIALKASRELVTRDLLLYSEKVGVLVTNTEKSITSAQHITFTRDARNRILELLEASGTVLSTWKDFSRMVQAELKNTQPFSTPNVILTIRRRREQLGLIKQQDSAQLQTYFTSKAENVFPILVHFISRRSIWGVLNEMCEAATKTCNWTKTANVLRSFLLKMERQLHAELIIFDDRKFAASLSSNPYAPQIKELIEKTTHEADNLERLLSGDFATYDELHNELLVHWKLCRKLDIIDRATEFCNRLESLARTVSDVKQLDDICRVTLEEFDQVPIDNRPMCEELVRWLDESVTEYEKQNEQTADVIHTLLTARDLWREEGKWCQDLVEHIPVGGGEEEEDDDADDEKRNIVVSNKASISNLIHAPRDAHERLDAGLLDKWRKTCIEITQKAADYPECKELITPELQERVVRFAELLGDNTRTVDVREFLANMDYMIYLCVAVTYLSCV